MSTGLAMTGEGGGDPASRTPHAAPRTPHAAPHTPVSAWAPPAGELSPEAAEGGNHAAFPPAPDPELAAIRRHFERLRVETEALGRQLPGFDPAAALRDPDFLRLTAPGMGVEPRRAWLVLHPELLERRAAETSAAALARSLASGAARPREGGGQSGAPLGTDYRSLPRVEQQRLKERILQAASRGEKIYP